MSVAGFFGSRIRPGTSDMNTSRLALSAMAHMAAATSALQLYIFPSSPRAVGLMTGVKPHHMDSLSGCDIDLDDFADVADVNFPAGIFLVVEPQLPAFENVPPGKAHRPAAEILDGFDNVRIDFARQNVIHDLHGGLVGDPLALDEIRLQPGLFHGTGDGLAAAVNDDGVDLDRFKKNNVPRDAGSHTLVRRVHEAAAVFDDEGRAVEFLDIRQRFQQRFGFGD